MSSFFQLEPSPGRRTDSLWPKRLQGWAGARLCAKGKDLGNRRSSAIDTGRAPPPRQAWGGQNPLGRERTGEPR